MAVLLTQYAHSARKQFERAGIESVRDIANTLDRDTESLMAILQTLSFSSRLPVHEFQQFHSLATRVANATGIPVVLSDPAGRQLVNTRLPFGTVLPMMATSYDSAFLSRKPVVTDLFTGSVAQESIYSVAVPVLNESTQTIPYLLNFSITPNRIRDVLLNSGLSPGAVAAVIDRNGHLLARSVGHERLLGTTPLIFMERVGDRKEGQFRHPNLDGVEILASFTRMKSTNWIVAHGYPVEFIDAPTRMLVWQLLALAFVMALIAVGGGFILSRRIVTALSSLEDAASAVGMGAMVAPIHTSVTEIDQVGARLASASHDLRVTTDAKDALLYEVNHRVKNSLAVITSLLAMHIRQMPDDRMRRGLDDLSARIDVIASVHQKLYESDRHDRLDLGLFLAEVAADMTLALGGARYAFTSDCEPGIIIGVDRTTPLALIVGELITNAVKHGGARGSGDISLTVKRLGDGRIMVAVADDGPGLVSDFGKPGTSGVGMRIVSGLARQIRGKLETNAGATGARFEITFDEAAS